MYQKKAMPETAEKDKNFRLPGFELSCVDWQAHISAFQPPRSS